MYPASARPAVSRPSRRQFVQGVGVAMTRRRPGLAALQSPSDSSTAVRDAAGHLTYSVVKPDHAHPGRSWLLAEGESHLGFAVPWQAVALREPVLQVVPAEELGAVVGKRGDPIQEHSSTYLQLRH